MDLDDKLKELNRAIKRAQGVHESIADDLYKQYKIVECTYCKSRRRISAADIANFMRKGWPQCCGFTMTMIKEDGSK